MSAVKAITPFEDRSRKRRLVKVVAWLVGIALLLVVLDLSGADIAGWFSDLWDTLTEISLQYIVPGLALQTVQTTLTALAWYYILDAGYPDGGTRYRQILAAYAAGVACGEEGGRPRGERGQRPSGAPAPPRRRRGRAA